MHSDHVGICFRTYKHCSCQMRGTSCLCSSSPVRQQCAPPRHLDSLPSADREHPQTLERCRQCPDPQHAGSAKNLSTLQEVQNYIVSDSAFSCSIAKRYDAHSIAHLHEPLAFASLLRTQPPSPAVLDGFLVLQRKYCVAEAAAQTEPHAWCQWQMPSKEHLQLFGQQSAEVGALEDCLFQAEGRLLSQSHPNCFAVVKNAHRRLKEVVGRDALLLAS